MTSTPADPLSNPTHAPIARAVTVWLIVQLAALLAIIFRLPLWAGGGDDDHALISMVTFQVAMSSLLFGLIMPNARAVICVTFCAIPFVQLAGVLGASPGVAIARGMAGVVIWLTSLSLCAMATRSIASRAIVTAAASSLSIGGALLAYAMNEFRDAPERASSAFGPLMSVTSLTKLAATALEHRFAWLTLAGLLAMSVAIAALRHRQPL